MFLLLFRIWFLFSEPTFLIGIQSILKIIVIMGIGRECSSVPFAEQESDPPDAGKTYNGIDNP